MISFDFYLSSKAALMHLAQSQNLLGDNFFSLLILAIGAALIIGPAMALIKPPDKPSGSNLEKAPRLRTFTQILLGCLMCIWAIASISQ